MEVLGFKKWFSAFYEGASIGYDHPIDTLKQGLDIFSSTPNPFDECFDPTPLTFYHEKNAYALGQGIGMVAKTGTTACGLLNYVGIPACQPIKPLEKLSGTLIHIVDPKDNRRKNFVKPNPEKTEQHRVSIRDSNTGEVIRYGVFKPNPYKPGSWIPVKRYDPIDSKTHGNVPAPHVHYNDHTGKGVRSARPSEMTFRDRKTLKIKIKDNL